MKKHEKTSKLRIFKKLSKSAGKSIPALGRVCFFPTWHHSVSHKNSAKKVYIYIFFKILIAQLSIWLKNSQIMNNLVIFVLYWLLIQNSYPHSSCCRKVPYSKDFFFKLVVKRKILLSKSIFYDKNQQIFFKKNSI